VLALPRNGFTVRERILGSGIKTRIDLVDASFMTGIGGERLRASLRRRGSSEGGFGIVELVVVLVIVGILATVALSVSIGARQRAQDRAAQADLRTAFAAARTHFSTGSTYVGFTAPVARRIEPAITWRGRGNPGIPGRVSIGGPNPTPTQVQLVAVSASGTYFCIKGVSTSGVRYGSGPAYRNVDTANECNQPTW
jgi:prepilin-type N-terminal cleavage/methylation domain-containing protein